MTLYNIPHLEDLIFTGKDGLRDVVYYLEHLGIHLASGISDLNISTKWDGAPAIVCGEDTHGKFFVATKSAFNKQPKLIYTQEDIQGYTPNPILQEKLLTCFQYLPELNIKGVLQGDMLYTVDELRHEQSTNNIIFQPNVIKYSIPFNTNLALRVLESKMGIIFHTTHNSQLTETSYKVDISSLRSSKNVWYRDASLVNGIGPTVVFEDEEYDDYRQQYYTIRNFCKVIPIGVLNKFSVNETIKRLTKRYVNDKIRKGENDLQDKDGTSFSATGLINFTNGIFGEEIIAAKKQETKENKMLKHAEIMRFFRENYASVQIIFELYNHIIDAKKMVIDKLNQMKDIDCGSYIPEGYVVSEKSGKVIKLVDRPVFSHANFNMERNW